MCVWSVDLSWSLVTSANAASTDSASVTTPARDTTGATLIQLLCSSQGVNPPTDSEGNTWTLVVSAIGGNRLRLYVCVNPTTGVAHTFTLGIPNPFPALVMVAWSGNSNSPVDQSSGAVATQPGSITPTQNGALVVTGSGDDDTDTPTVSPPFDAHLLVAQPGGAHSEGIGFAYEIQTTATPRNPTWNTAASRTTLIASFLPSVVASIVPQVMMHRNQMGES